jgi:hypothetical protein
MCVRVPYFLSGVPGVSSVSTRDTEQSADRGEGALIAEEVDGVGSKGSGDTTVNVETPLETIMEDFQIWEHFS